MGRGHSISSAGAKEFQLYGSIRWWVSDCQGALVEVGKCWLAQPWKRINLVGWTSGTVSVESLNDCGEATTRRGADSTSQRRTIEFSLTVASGN